MTNLMVLPGNQKIGRQDLRDLPTPAPTATHQPVPHWRLVEALVETLGFRHIGVMQDEYAVSRDGMRMFGVLNLDISESGIQFSIGIRNAHDKSMTIGVTVGYKVLVCENMAFGGDFTPILKKHSKNLDLIELVSVGVDSIQRHFQPLIKRIDVWRGFELSDLHAKGIIYDAFVARRLKAPKYLAEVVHQHYFEPEYEEFKARSLWRMQNAFTSSFKDLDPIPQFEATARLSPFLARYE